MVEKVEVVQFAVYRLAPDIRTFRFAVMPFHVSLQNMAPGKFACVCHDEAELEATMAILTAMELVMVQPPDNRDPDVLGVFI